MQYLTMRPIGFVHSPFSQADQIPHGLGAKHDEQGMLEILPEFEAGLQDVDAFSHLYVLWVFDRSQGYDLVSTPPCDTRAHGVFATRSPRRPNPIGLSVVGFSAVRATSSGSAAWTCWTARPSSTSSPI